MMGVESDLAGGSNKGAIMGATPDTPTPASATPDAGGSSAGTENAGATPSGTEVTPTLTGDKPSIVGKAGSAVVADPTGAPPAYTPNLKFKSFGKELEFDEWAKSAAKDPETEKKIRELYEKAHGLEPIKQDRESIKRDLAETKEKYTNVEKAIETVSEYARTRDWDSFFEALSIPKNEILKYAVELVQRENMPPEQKAQWESARQAQQTAKYYQTQNQQLQSSQQQFMVQQRTFQLSQEMSKPDISPVVEAYNTGAGKPGAFEDYVIRIGMAHHAQGHDISVQDAVREAVQHLRAVNPTLGVQSVAPQAAAPSQVVQPSGKPTLPNIQGRGTSPVKSTIRSLDDIKQRARELDARG